MIKQNLIFMGQPGVGKGTVASLIAKNSELVHLSTGSIFRSEISNKTELGKKVEFYVNSGGYVPDEITNEIVKQAILKLKKENKYFILDGFPRTIAQAEFLKNIPDLNFKVIELTVPESIILERLSGRRVCTKCGTGYHIKFKPPIKEGVCDLDNEQLLIRNDDKPEKIINRLSIYNEQTKPLLSYCKNDNSLVEITAIEEPENVAKKVIEILK